MRGGGSGLPYQPALDGVRGLAVAMVVVFHAGFGWMSGGYVGVSVFFTLSGYLITSLALAEHDRTGRFALGAFYARRIRRLAPASLLCLAGVMVAARDNEFWGITELRRDLWAALAQVYNWAALANGESYAEQVEEAAGQRAPLDHYWSLAIEEQFYLVWPLVLLAVLRWRRPGRLIAVGAVTAAAVVATVVTVHVWGGDAAYFATPARLPEILCGCLAAVALHRPGARRWLHRVGADWAGAAGLGVIVWAALAWPARDGPAASGWLAALAVASTALIVGLQVGSPLRWALSWPPLVALGRISYGVYLFHWPVYTIVDERRFDIGRVPLFAVRLAITLAIAATSFALIERPVRRVERRRPTFATAAMLTGAAAFAVPYVPESNPLFIYVAPETADVAAVPLVAEGTEPPELELLAPWDAGDGLPVLSRPVRVVTIGDSTANALAQGLIQWSAAHPDVLRITNRAYMGCGLSDSGRVPEQSNADGCDIARELLPGLVDLLEPDVVVAMVTTRDLQDHTWGDDEGALPLTDPRHRRRLLGSYERLTRSLLDSGATLVLWVIPPVPVIETAVPEGWLLDSDVYATYRGIVEDLTATMGSDVLVGDLDGWVAAGEQPERPDGIHLSLDGAEDVVAGWLVPELLAATVSR